MIFCINGDVFVNVLIKGKSNNMMFFLNLIFIYVCEYIVYWFVFWCYNYVFRLIEYIVICLVLVVMIELSYLYFYWDYL